MDGLRLIGIDLHGTLVRDDGSYDRDRFARVIKRLQAKNICISVISGHSRLETAAYLTDVDVTDMYIVSHNGNWIEYNDAVIHRVNVPATSVERILAYQDQLEPVTTVLDAGDSYYYLQTYPEHRKALDQVYPQAQPLAHSDALTVDNIFKIAYYSTQSGLNRGEFVRQIRPDHPELDIVPRHTGWIEFYGDAGGKGQILAWIQDREQITPGETLVFGNRHNDVAMNAHAAYPIAVANAGEMYLDITPYRIGTNNDQAVIDVLEEIVANDNLTFLDHYAVTTGGSR